MEREGEPWFVAKDVCTVLTIANARSAVTGLDADESITVAIADGKRGNPNKQLVSESGLYALVMAARKPQARAFRKWVTSVVLPAIRKDGAYIKGEEHLTGGLSRAHG
nr:BRO family protein [uncultured Pseudacidovorax sp.]